MGCASTHSCDRAIEQINKALDPGIREGMVPDAKFSPFLLPPALWFARTIEKRQIVSSDPTKSTIESRHPVAAS